MYFCLQEKKVLVFNITFNTMGRKRDSEKCKTNSLKNCYIHLFLKKEIELKLFF